MAFSMIKLNIAGKIRNFSFCPSAHLHPKLKIPSLQAKNQFSLNNFSSHTKATVVFPPNTVVRSPQNIPTKTQHPFYSVKNIFLIFPNNLLKCHYSTSSPTDQEALKELLEKYNINSSTEAKLLI